jgi:hypothetical protein
VEAHGTFHTAHCMDCNKVSLAFLISSLKNRIFMWSKISVGDPDPLVRGTDPAPDPSLFS